MAKDRMYGFPANLARPLTDIARERLARPHIASGVELPPGDVSAARCYVLEPIEPIPAARKGPGGFVIPGSGECYIMRVDREGDDGGSTGEESELIYQTDDSGERVEVTAYNLGSSEAPEESEGSGSGDNLGVVLAIQDMFGSLWIVQASDGDGHVPFTLTEDIGATTSGEASATILEWDFSTTKHAGETVLDNGGIFADGTSGSKGIAVKIGSDYHIIQLACGGE